MFSNTKPLKKDILVESTIKIVVFCSDENPQKGWQKQVQQNITLFPLPSILTSYNSPFPRLHRYGWRAKQKKNEGITVYSSSQLVLQEKSADDAGITFFISTGYTVSLLAVCLPAFFHFIKGVFLVIDMILVAKYSITLWELKTTGVYGLDLGSRGI